MVIEIIVIYGVHGRSYRVGIDNLLVLLIGGIPIAMPTVLSVTMAIGSHRLSQQVCRLIFVDCFWICLAAVYSTALQSCQYSGCISYLMRVSNIFYIPILQGAITKRMTAIEEMAGMDVLCSDKTGTLTLNKLTVDKNMIEVVLVISLHSEFTLHYIRPYVEYNNLPFKLYLPGFKCM